MVKMIYIILFVAMISIVSAEISTQEDTLGFIKFGDSTDSILDKLCSTDNMILMRIDGTWQCSDNYSINVSVNQSDYWDNLDTPGDILMSTLNDDNTYVRVDGDTMSGSLTVNADVNFTGNVYLGNTTDLRQVLINTATPMGELHVRSPDNQYVGLYFTTPQSGQGVQQGLYIGMDSQQAEMKNYEFGGIKMHASPDTFAVKIQENSGGEWGAFMMPTSGDLYYRVDGGAEVIRFEDSTADVKIGRDIRIASDNRYAQFGAGTDVQIGFSGADLLIDSADVTANDEVLFTDFDAYNFDDDIYITNSINSGTHITLDNPNTGSSAYTVMNVQNNDDKVSRLGISSTNADFGGTYADSGSTFLDSQGTTFNIIQRGTTDDFKFYSGGVDETDVVMTIDSNKTEIYGNLDVYEGFIKLPTNTTSMVCNSTNAGYMYYDGNIPGKGHICNGIVWRDLNT